MEIGKPDRSFCYLPLLLLAVGTFAIGTEGFMIAAILPKIAGDLRVSIGAAGQLMAVFALAYAVSSPILTALTGNIDRKRLLTFSMGAFVVANLVASVTPNYWSLLVARILLALSAGLFVPNANALTSVLVPPEQRGRGLAIVTGGLTVAVALGVPLGAVIGTQFGWRATFWLVALLGAIALVGLLIGLPREVGRGLPSTTLSQRLAVIRQPGIVPGLLTTTLWGMGAYTLYTYIAPYLSAVAGIEGAQIGLVLFLWGVGAAVGLFAGGIASDRVGSGRVLATVLPILVFVLAGFSLTAHFAHARFVLLPVLLGVAVWGIAGWSFAPAQQSRLIDAAGVQVANVALSLNASFMYLGFSLGAALGGFTLAHGTVGDLGWVGALAEAAALGLFHFNRVSRRSLAGVPVAEPI